MHVAVVSGKGGTGKTVITAALATLLPEPIVLADCDVDCANLDLLLSARSRSREPYFGMGKARVLQELCTRCGACQSACRFFAVFEEEGVFRIDPDTCEGCAVCTLFCPSDAIVMEKDPEGEIITSDSITGPLVHANLRPGAGGTGLLVHQVKRRVQAIAGHEPGSSGKCPAPLPVLVDGPPGIGCPLLSTLAGVSHVIIVTEASITAVHDMRRLLNVMVPARIDISVIINRAGQDGPIRDEICQLCRDEHLCLLGEVPFDPVVAGAVSDGVPFTTRECPATTAIRTIAGAFLSRIQG